MSSPTCVMPGGRASIHTACKFKVLSLEFDLASKPTILQTRKSRPRKTEKSVRMEPDSLWYPCSYMLYLAAWASQILKAVDQFRCKCVGAFFCLSLVFIFALGKSTFVSAAMLWRLCGSAHTALQSHACKLLETLMLHASSTRDKLQCARWEKKFLQVEAAFPPQLTCIQAKKPRRCSLWHDMCCVLTPLWPLSLLKVNMTAHWEGISWHFPSI